MSLLSKKEERKRVKEFEALAPGLIPGNVVVIGINHIKRNPRQPRKYFDGKTISVLAGSLEEDGDVDCPIHVTVRKDHVLLVDGERRFRASQEAGIEKMSCFILPPLSDKKVFLRSARANFGREGMSPVEEARAIQEIMLSEGCTQAEVSKIVSKYPPQVSQLLKYLRLDDEIQDLVIRREISNGVAIILTSYPREKQRDILSAIESARKERGGSIQQNDALRVAQARADQLGVAPVRSARGRKTEALSHSDAVAKNILSKIAAFDKAINEMAHVVAAAGGVEKFAKSLNKINILTLAASFKAVEKRVQEQVKILSFVS